MLRNKFWPSEVESYDELPAETRALMTPDQFLVEYTKGSSGRFVLAEGSRDEQKQTEQKQAEQKPTGDQLGIVDALKSLLGLSKTTAGAKAVQEKVVSRGPQEAGNFESDVISQIEKMFEESQKSQQTTAALMGADFKRQFEAGLPQNLTQAGKALLADRFGKPDAWEIRDGQWVLASPSGFSGSVPPSGYTMTEFMGNLNRYEVPLFAQSSDSGPAYTPPVGKTFTELYQEDSSQVARMGLEMGAESILGLK